MTFEEIKQTYFLSAENQQECEKWLALALKEAAAFVQNSAGHKIHSDITLQGLEKLFSQIEMPHHGEGLPPVFERAISEVMRHSVRVSSPKFIGHMTGASPYFGMICDLLISALNQNVVKIETALSASFVEGQTLAWLHKLIFKQPKKFYQRNIHAPSNAFGNVTSGGTLGNLTALTVARNKRFADAASNGLFSALVQSGYSRAVILVSKRGHYSLRKAASILGLGSQNVIEIPVVPFENRICIDSLRKTISQLQKDRACILAIVGVAGTTETGSVDDLVTLGKLAKECNAWFHVDAAWGGPLLLSQQHSHLLRGIEAADSVVVDGHKLFYLPMSHGCVLFQDIHALDSVRHSARYIIRSGSVDLGRTSLEGSRRFESFKMWFFLRTLGQKGLESLVNHAIELGHNLARLVEKNHHLQLTSAVTTNIVTYRFVPCSWKTVLENLRYAPLPDRSNEQKLMAVRFAQAFLNELNIEIQKKQRKEGKSFVSRTTLESVYQQQETVVFRAVPFHPMTSQPILQEILEEQILLGKQLAMRQWKRWKHNAPENFAHYFALDELGNPAPKEKR